LEKNYRDILDADRRLLTFVDIHERQIDRAVQADVQRKNIAGGDFILGWYKCRIQAIIFLRKE